MARQNKRKGVGQPPVRRANTITSDVAIRALEELKVEAEDPGELWQDFGLLDSWKLRLHTMVTRSLGTIITL